jgi:hypothetical protein
LPSLVAVIVVDPVVTPATRPLADTVAAAGLLLTQLIARPARGFPAESFGVAVSWTVPPTATLADAGLTVMDATGTFVTVTDIVPLFPSLVAVTVAVPAALAVTSPVEDTDATDGALLVQLIERPLSGAPPESFGTALS